jgi:hypothetical protein
LAKCPKCGNKGFLLEISKCASCQKKGCEKCLKKMFTVRTPKKHDWNFFTCSSKDCFDKFVHDFKNTVNPVDVSIDSPLTDEDIYYLFRDSFFSRLPPELNNQLYDEEAYIVFEGSSALGFYSLISKHIDVLQAQNLEKAGRFEEAALVYDKYGMFEESEKLRRKEKEVAVKQTALIVDLNRLLQQVKDGGIFAVYRCPNCNGKLEVGRETTVNSLRTCQYCGTEIEALDLADFLKTALS